MDIIRISNGSKDKFDLLISDSTGQGQWINGLSVKSNVEDIIVKYLLGCQLNNPGMINQYTLFEVNAGVEKPLKFKFKLDKYVKDWSGNDVKLMLKKTSSKTSSKGPVDKVKEKARNLFGIKDKKKSVQLFSMNHEEVDEADNGHVIGYTRVAEGKAGGSSDLNQKLRTLVDIVKSQGTEIKKQLQRISEAEEKIENYEIYMHHIYSESHGKNYLQTAYDEHYDHEEYEKLLMDIYNINEKLLTHHLKIETLNSMIKSEMNQADLEFVTHLDMLRTEIRICNDKNIQRDLEIVALDSRMEEISVNIKSKEEMVNQLISQLKQEESLEMNSLSTIIGDDSEVSEHSDSQMLPTIGMESVAKVFSTRLMPELSLAAPSKNITVDLKEAELDDTSVWNTEDDGIDVTFKAEPYLNTTNDDTYHLLNNHSVIDSSVNSNDTTHGKYSAVKKRLFQGCEHVNIEIRGALEDVLGEISVSSDSSESGMGSLHSDDSTDEIRGWGRLETRV